MNEIAIYIGYTVMVISSIAFIGWLLFFAMEKAINAYAGAGLIYEFLVWKRDTKKDE